MFTREVVEDLGGEFTIPPGEARIRGVRDEAIHFSARQVSLGVIHGVGLDPRVVKGCAQPFPDSWEEGELLLIGELPALSNGLGGVDGRALDEALIFSLITIIQASGYDPDFLVGQDVIFDRLVEPTN